MRHINRTKKVNTPLHLTVNRVTRTLFFGNIVYGVSIIMFDAGNLITRDAVVDRWSVLTILLSANTVIWFLNTQNAINERSRAILIGVLALIVLLVAGMTTYWERGMASSSTLLYILPLLIVATLKNRHGLLAITTLSAATYSFAAVRYFNDFFNEGYRIQLWGTLVFNIGMLYTATWIIMILTDLRKDSN